MAKKLVGTLCFAALILAGAPAFAQSFTLKVGDIQGSSTVPGAVGFIDVLSFSYGVASDQTSIGVKASATSAKAACSSFNTMMRLGKETGDLFLAVMQGTHFDTATFKVFDTSGAPAFDLAFSNVLLTSLQQSGSEGGDLATQSLSLISATTTLTLYHAAGHPPTASEWSCAR